MPQSFLDELWFALPSLRDLLDFEGGWAMAQRETWERLFVAISGHFSLRYHFGRR